MGLFSAFRRSFVFEFWCSPNLHCNKICCISWILTKFYHDNTSYVSQPCTKKWIFTSNSFRIIASKNWNWIVPKLSEVWYFKFGVLLTYTAIKFDTLFGFSQNFDMITPITLTNHVAKFESIPQILFELLHYKRWCVFFRPPDILSRMWPKKLSGY